MSAPQSHDTVTDPALDQPRTLRWQQWALVGYWLALAVATHWPRLHLSAEGDGRPYVNPDKLLHFSAFWLLTVLLFAAQRGGRAGNLWRRISIAAIVAALYAPLDELTQTLVAERTASWADLTADWLGVACAGIGLVGCRFTRKSRDRVDRVAQLARVATVALAGVYVVCIAMPGWPSGVTFGELALPAGLEAPDGMKWIRADFVGNLILTAVLAATVMHTRSMPSVMTGRAKFGFIFFSFCLTIWLPVSILAARSLCSDDFMGTVSRAGMNAGIVVGSVLGFVLGLLRCTVHPFVQHDDTIKNDFTSRRGDLRPHACAPEQEREQPQTPSTEPPPETEDHAHPDRFVGHAITVSLLTILSRITGLVRDAVLAAAFGLGATADAFFMAFLVPNLFRRLFGEGALTAAFVPVYTRLVNTDRLTARRLASLSIALLVVVLSAVTLVGEAVLAYLVMRDISADAHLTLRMAMIMLPYMPVICVVALLGGVLQVHGRFGAPAAAPIILNVGMIVAAVLGSQGVIGDGSTDNAVVVISVGVLIAGVGQLLWQGLAVVRVETFTTSLRDAWPAFREMMGMMGPMVIGLAVFQINTFMDSVIAFTLSPKEGGPETLTFFGRQAPYPIDTGGVAALQWAQRLYWFPLGVFGIAIATAIFPALSRAATMSNAALSRERLGDVLRQGLRLSMFITLPASVGLILVRVPLTRAIYERGRFETDDALRVATILIGYASVVWAYSMTHVLTRACYAVRDAKTPLLISTGMVVINLLLNVVLIWPMGVAGLAWSSAVSAIGQVVCLLLVMKHYTGTLLDRSVWISWGRTALACVVMGAVVIVLSMWRDSTAGSTGGATLDLTVLVIAGAAVFGISALAMRAPELRWLIKRRIS